MDMDTITLYLKSVTDKMTNNLKNAIQTWQQYDNATSKVANGIKNVTNATNSVNSNFSNSKMKAEDLKKELEELTSEYNRQSKAFSERPANMNAVPYNPTKNLEKGSVGESGSIILTQEKLDREKELLDELQANYNEMVADVEKPVNTPELVPKTGNAVKKFEEAGQKADEASKKVSRLGNVLRSLGSISKNITSKGFDLLKNKFNGFSKDLGKGVSKNVFTIKKLALGLIGVRTAMSVLTKSVNAYLSFDSDLQDSLTNSWNMLGSLLAPAIELVARLFAMATNYIAQFVSALTGIDLVARANAKSLESQAKATQKASKAQRGLLSMDEITNLPTESSVTPASQIQIDDTIKSFKLLDDILAHLKEGQWHLVGEDIARGIDNLLGSINWGDIKSKAYKLGYNFADFLNGLFEVDWNQLGNTISETINTFIELVKGFIDKFSFIQLGVGLANMISKAFLNIDWDELAKTINTGIEKIGDGISVFLTTFKWGDIGGKFGDFVASIDWGGLLFEAIKNSLLLMSGLGEFLTSFFEELFDKVADKIGDKVDKIFKDLENGNINFTDWLKKAIPKAFKGILNSVIGTLNTVISKVNKFLIPLRALIVTLGNVAGKKWTLNNISLPMIPTLATGTNDIEYEGLYHLHEGEAVVPKRYNPATGGYDNSIDNKQIIELLVSLNSSMLEYAERPININMNSRKVAEAIYDDTEQLDRNRNKSNAVVRS